MSAARSARSSSYWWYVPMVIGSLAMLFPPMGPPIEAAIISTFANAIEPQRDIGLAKRLAAARLKPEPFIHGMLRVAMAITIMVPRRLV